MITTNILSETVSHSDLPDCGTSLDKQKIKKDKKRVKKQKIKKNKKRVKKQKIISQTPESCIEVIPIGEESLDLPTNSKFGDF